MKIENMESSKGNKVANQFIIRAKDGVYFQSYNSIIAVKYNTGSIKLDRTYWDYSTTTGKYRNIFLGEDKATTEKKIKSGVYRLADLNGGN
jgi:hypothetical protein